MLNIYNTLFTNAINDNQLLVSTSNQNKLLLNLSKTSYIVLNTHQNQHSLKDKSIKVGITYLNKKNSIIDFFCFLLFINTRSFDIQIKNAFNCL